MPAPEGNKYWQMRSKDGKPKIHTPESLWEGAVKYFEWVETNPLWEYKVFNYQGDIVESQIPIMRAMTIEGLTLSTNISRTTWKNYCANEDYVEVTGQIEAIIREQKFTGAAGNLLNNNIIARDLGLRDAKDTTVNAGENVSITMSFDAPKK